jgi:hypothetical protein
MGNSRDTRKTLPQFTDRLVLGTQGRRVSPFCLGWVHSPDTITAAFDAGINFFFITTDLHWPGYEATRSGVRQLPSLAAFDRDYAGIGRPVILTNLLQGTRAAKKWTPDYLIKTIGTQDVILPRLRNHKLRSGNIRYTVPSRTGK